SGLPPDGPGAGATTSPRRSLSMLRAEIVRVGGGGGQRLGEGNRGPRPEGRVFSLSQRVFERLGEGWGEGRRGREGSNLCFRTQDSRVSKRLAVLLASPHPAMSTSPPSPRGRGEDTA